MSVTSPLLVAADGDLHADFVAAERIDVFGGGVGVLEVPEIARIAIVIEDEIPVKVVH